MAKTDFRCTCGKSFKTFENLAKHTNRTSHLLELSNQQTKMTWQESLLFTFMDNAYTMEGALVVLLFLIVVVSSVLFYWVI